MTTSTNNVVRLNAKVIEAINAAAIAAAGVFNSINEGNTKLAEATTALQAADTARINNRPVLATAILATIKASAGKVERRALEKGGVQRYLDKESPAYKALATAEGVMLSKVIGAETKSAKKHWSVCTQMAFDGIDGNLSKVTATEPKATTEAKARGKGRAVEEDGAMSRFLAAFVKMTAAPAQPTTGNAFGDAYHAAVKSHQEVAKLRSDRIARAERHKTQRARKAA